MGEILGMTTEKADKEKELYDLMLDKLYKYFVVEKNGVKIETAVDILALLKTTNTAIKTKKEIDVL